MIVDLQRFIAAEREHWDRLEAMLDALETGPGRRMALDEITQFHDLYQRCSADLGKIATFSGETALRRYLEGLVARAYGEIHETRDQGRKLNPLAWFLGDFPRAFRRRLPAFLLALAITALGCAFGAAALAIDPEAKAVIMPFMALRESPAERVRKEESIQRDRLAGQKSAFAAQLMTHNTRVTFFTMAMGVTWGVGTALALFYNGVIIGAISWDYVHAGQGPFLAGWLLPHGAVEIPSILLGGQAGFLLAGALIGWGGGAGRRATRRQRLREISPDLVSIVFGAATLLIWAGIVEAFLSQYHQPVIPYALKIAFGAAELGALTLFLSRAGRSRGAGAKDAQPE